MNLNFFESTEQLVQVHWVGQIEEGEIRNRRDLGHHPISLLIVFLLYVFLVVLEADQISLLYEVCFLIGRDLLDHHLVFLLELVVVARVGVWCLVAVGGVLEVDVEVVGCRIARHVDRGFALRHDLHIVCLLDQSFAGL